MVNTSASAVAVTDLHVRRGKHPVLPGLAVSVTSGVVVGLTDLANQADQLVGSLSGGQRSRVSLAGALLGSHDLLVLTNPPLASTRCCGLSSGPCFISSPPRERACLSPVM